MKHRLVSKEIKGTIRAEDERAAGRKLLDMGFLPKEITAA